MWLRENQYRMDRSRRLISTKWGVKEKSIQGGELKKADTHKMGS